MRTATDRLLGFVEGVSRAAAMDFIQANNLVREQLIGRECRVLSNFNGQPHGRSRKPWTGKVCKIQSAYIDDHDNSKHTNRWWRSQIIIQLENASAAMHLSEVELI